MDILQIEARPAFNCRSLEKLRSADLSRWITNRRRPTQRLRIRGISGSSVRYEHNQPLTPYERIAEQRNEEAELASRSVRLRQAECRS
jgi:hypothetical protein